MARLIIDIEMDNAAFEQPGPEVARILRKLADRADHGIARDTDGRIYSGHICHLIDLNGNTVGSAVVKATRRKR